MRLSLRCRACGAEHEIRDEPRQLATWKCRCGQVGEARAFEDAASALEDVLAQLAWIDQAAELEVHMGTAAIPEAFRPDVLPSKD